MAESLGHLDLGALERIWRPPAKYQLPDTLAFANEILRCYCSERRHSPADPIDDPTKDNNREHIYFKKASNINERQRGPN